MFMNTNIILYIQHPPQKKLIIEVFLGISTSSPGWNPENCLLINSYEKFAQTLKCLKPNTLHS